MNKFVIIILLISFILCQNQTRQDVLQSIQKRAQTLNKKIDPDLETMSPPTSFQKFFMWFFAVDYSATSCHPLNIAGIQFPAITCTVFMPHPSV